MNAIIRIKKGKDDSKEVLRFYNPVFVAGRRWHPEGEYWSGNDLRYIQKLLGHKNRKITEIYIKVSIKDLRKITGPLDL